MVITESELREMWRDGRNALPAFPTGTRFSPAAQDFLKDHKLGVHFADAVPVSIPAPQLPLTHYKPLITNYQLPAALDTLVALAQLVAAEARRYQLPTLSRRLDALAGYCLELRAAEQQGREPTPSPARAGGGQAFRPGPTEHAMLHWLNFLRATARQVAAQAGEAGSVKMAEALGQVSDEAADLGRRVQTGELGWNPMGHLTSSG